MVDGQNKSHLPHWASILGVVAIVLGVFLTAMHGTEWMKHSVISTHMPESGVMPAADCPEEELEEEGITIAQCEFLVDYVAGFVESAPEGFSDSMKTLAFIGTIVAFVSVIIGGALVNYTTWSANASIAVFAGLALIDVLQFSVVVGAGPLIRDIYLWSVLLWLILHAMLLVGAIAGRQFESGKA